MELEYFVTETLGQIIRGVAKAQENAAAHGAEINPPSQFIRADKTGNRVHRSSGRVIEIVDFDVAVTASEGKQSRGGIGVFVGSVGVGAQGQSQAARESISRIKFSVPILFREQGT